MLKAPTQMFGQNVFDLLVNDVGEQRATELLEVTRKTLRRWRCGESTVPRMAVLALYWESTWGRSQIDSSRSSEIEMWRGFAQSLQRDLRKAQERIDFLQQDAVRSANDPWFVPITSGVKAPGQPVALPARALCTAQRLSAHMQQNEVDLLTDFSETAIVLSNDGPDGEVVMNPRGDAQAPRKF